MLELFRKWMLPIAMVTGASLYLIYHSIPALAFAGPFLEKTCSILQPLLIFLMLFLTFCKIEPSDLRPHRWHWWHLLIQGGIFTVCGLAVVLVEWLASRGGFSIAGKHIAVGFTEAKVVLESMMLLLICPTATAAAVVTGKLGGDIPGVITYTILINFLAALLVPAIVPMVNPGEGLDFFTTFSRIMAKVFPLLILPSLCAWLLRYLFPRVHRRLMRYPDAAFYLWSVGLTLAIAVTTKALVKSELSPGLMLGMALVSLLCCAFQFFVGQKFGAKYYDLKLKEARKRKRGDVENEALKRSCITTAGQALGQKNTLFAIWMGYTFMTPETAIVGGLYSIWHNLFNSWQLARASETTKVLPPM